MEPTRSGLRARLLSITIGLAVAVTVLFGAVAYRITLQSATDREYAALVEKSRLLAAYAAEHIDAAGASGPDQTLLRRAMSPYVSGETMVQLSSPHWELALSPRGPLPAQELRRFSAVLSSGIGNTGKIDSADRRFLWASHGERDALRVSIVRETGFLDGALDLVARRLLLTGVAAVWVALWAGLVLTAAVARRQDSYNAVLAHRATHDDLTGLPNRTRLQDCLTDAATRGASGALLVMDLDRFKEVNDTLGHGYGDALLKVLGPRLADSLREGDLLARLGGDEFAIWLPDADKDLATRVADRLIGSLNRPLDVMGMPLEISASVGIACFPTHTDNVEELVRYADMSMYQAKRQRLGTVVYAPDNDHHSVMRLRLAGEIRAAIDECQFVLFYQPKINVRDGTLAGVEALVRWQHPEYGLLMPDQFVGLTEQSGLIHDFTFHVLDLALAQCARWLAAGLECPVSVNLSPYNLLHPDLTGTVKRGLARHALPPGMLELELTETAAMSDIAQTARIFERLTEHGVGLAIDDFGTGMSSLAYLSTLSSCAIKIDRSFVMNMLDDRHNQVIVRSIVSLARNLGRTCVAEGVENDETLDQLREIGCDLAQGYHIGRPCPADDELLARLSRLAVAHGSHPASARPATPAWIPTLVDKPMRAC